MRTIKKIITKVSTKYGSPMGRGSVGDAPTDGTKIFDCFVPMSGAYDTGGAYWGLAIHGAKPLRVSYTKDLQFIHFYRK